MSVVGFDIGNDNCVIASVKQRGIDVLLNDESNRETPAVVCFGEKQRFLGSAGAASATMNPKSTISQLKRLIGQKFRDHSIQDELKTFPFETSEGPDGGILIILKYLSETHAFTPVQIMGMLFSHLKDTAEKNLEVPVVDCVIGIPSYFSELQRRAYLNAAAIAGLKPLRLIHDCTATALTYGIYKSDFPSGGPSYVAFVDIGHCDTQVSIVSFVAGHMKVLSHAFDSNLGGRNFDEVLFSYFAAQFKQQYNIDVYSNVRASIRLRAACEKLKKVLSANAGAPLNIECLMDEKDVKGFITREEFENLSSGLLEKISFPCNKALVDAGLSTGKIHSLELVGSGSRIPAITRLLASLFKKEPSRQLNASECVARGCALQCAMLSPVFRVREYEVQDCVPFSIGFSSEEGPIGAVSNSILFPKGHSIPSVKVLTLQRNNLFHLESYYADPDELPVGVSPNLSSFIIGPFQGSHSEKAKVKIRVQLNLHGIVTVDSAVLVKNDVDNSATQGGASNSSSGSGDCMIKDKGTRRLEIPISENVYGGMTMAELAEAHEKELQLTQQDKAMEQTKERKNALESYVYDMRSKLFNTYRSFATDQERDGISKNLQETEEWLYGDGDDETETAYNSKLENLKILVDPIENRHKDGEARVEATRDLSKYIEECRKAANPLPSEQRELILDECNKAEEWLRDKTQQQESLPKHVDPLYWSSEIKSRTEDLKTICTPVSNSKASPKNKHADHWV